MEIQDHRTFKLKIKITYNKIQLCKKVQAKTKQNIEKTHSLKI